MTPFEHVEHGRRIANLICPGVIEAVDHAGQRLKVRAKTVTGWLPWPTEMGRNYRRWRPLRAGQHVILGSPSGDLSQAVIIGMLYTASRDAPAVDPNIDVIAFDNGASVRHDAASGAMTIVCKGDLTLEVSGTLTQKASAHRIEGPVTHTGGDIRSDGISAQRHTHTGVTAGSARTGVPQ